MEELQDALEDAQYVNAINLDEGPRPITAWEKPSEEEMSNWKSGLKKVWNDDKKKDALPEPFTYDWVLANPLGLFMFSAYIKETSDDYVQINFMEDLLRWRYLRGRSRGAKLREIYDRYLLPCQRDEETKAPRRPPLSLIDEVDLEYDYVSSKISGTYSVQELIDDSCRYCAIGVKGPLYEEVVTILAEYLSKDSIDDTAGTDDMSVTSSRASASRASEQELDPANDSGGEEKAQEVDSADVAFKKFANKTSSKILSKAPKDLFDKLEQVVLKIIRLKHWEAFKASSEWPKLINYMWHRDRKVVDEDFFLMRVLGRGGFGLVTGRYYV
jgi:hypothetical protein